MDAGAAGGGLLAGGGALCVGGAAALVGVGGALVGVGGRGGGEIWAWAVGGVGDGGGLSFEERGAAGEGGWCHAWGEGLRVEG